MPVFSRKDRRHRVMYDVHSWLGVAIGLALYFMFITGVVALFHHPLAGWEEPAHHTSAPMAPQIWVDGLIAAAPAEAERVIVTFPEPDEGLFGPTGYVEHPRGTFQEYNWHHAAGGGSRWVERRSGAAEFLNHLHFFWHAKAAWGMYIAALLSVALLVALTTGLVIHLRDLLPQLRQFRIRRTVLVAWTDLHKVTGVLSLPFTYMMAYTGALIIFATALMGVVAAPVFGANPERIREVVTGPALPTARPIAATDVRLPVSAWMERAEAAIPGLEITLLEQRPDTSRVRVGGEVEGVRGFLEAHLDGVTGAVEKADRPHDLRPAQSTTNFMFALHFGTVGGWATKVVYAWLALIAAVTMISGNAMWLLRRRKRGLFGRGTAFLEGCTFGTGAGLPLATAATFYATQVYPFDWSDRVPGLELTFIVALAVSNLGAVVSRDRWRTASRQLILTGVLFLSLPFLRPGGLIGGGPAYLLAVELGWLVLAVVCFFVGLRLAGRTDLVRPSSVEAVEAPSHV